MGINLNEIIPIEEQNIENMIYEIRGKQVMLDKKDVYHIGSSLNHASKRVFSINKLEDKIIIDNLLNYTQTIID